MKKRILVLDDNQDILDIVMEVLTYEGYEVLCAINTDHFDERVIGWKPDVAILDFKLMDGNGGELCKKLKAGLQTKHIPVILFSAYIPGKIDLSSYGSDAVIAKPFDLTEFTDKVRDVLIGNNV
jgi:DNA-binding response OmpR family regulator